MTGNPTLDLAIGITGVFLIPGVLTGLIAESKGYSAVWAIPLTLISLIGTLLVLFVLPDRSDSRRDQDLAQ